VIESGGDVSHNDRESVEDLNQLFFDLPFFGMAIIDANSHKWLKVNDRLCEILGHSRDSLLDTTWDRLTHPDDLANDLSQYQRLLAGELDNYPLEKRFLREDGSPVEVMIDVRCSRDAEGRAEHVLKTVRDISERKRSERDLQYSHTVAVSALQYQRAILEGVTGATDVMLVYLDLAFNFVWMNEAYAKTCGRRPEEMVGRNHFDLYPDAENEAIFRQVRDSGVAVFFKDRAFEFPDQPERGVTYWDWSLAPVKNDTGQVQGLVFTLRETTQYKRAELELKSSEEKYRSLVEQASDGIFVADAHGFYIDVNSAGCAMLGYTREELLRLSIADVIDPAEIPRIESEVSRFADEAVTVSVWRFRRKDGSFFPGEVRARRLADGRLQAILIDITERKAAEQALEAARVAAIEEKHLLETVMQALPVGVAIVDERGGTIRSNAEYDQIWGNPRPPTRSVDDYDAYKACWGNTGQPVQPHEWASALALQTGKLVANQLLQIQRFDGTQTYVLNSAAPIRDAYDNIVGSAVVIQDITELKQAEMALRDADQRKDEFLAMLAHELRNPLAPIRNAAHVLGRLGLDNPQLRWAQDMITQQVAHLSHMVDDLLDVSRIARGKINLRIERLDLADLVRLARDGVEEEMAAKGHRFEVHLPEARVKLDGDPVRLVQVLQNLLTNAAKYTADGGHIELSAKPDAGEVMIEVRDNGMGIAPDLLPDIFDLFRQGERTLDRSQGGLGIGLTLVRKLVEMHGGRVEAHSAGPGLGATFSVHLPLPPAQESERSAAPVKDVKRTAAGLRVLVVDDDPPVAESMCILLELEGHEVRCVLSGDAALELLKTFRPEVVLLDIGLPGQDGYTVARRIRDQPEGNNIRLVAVSGYGHEEAIVRSREAGFDSHLVKPVEPASLLALLGEFGGQRT